MTEEDFREEGYYYQMGVPPIRVDIMMGIPGLTFAEAWKRKNEIDFDGLLIPFISKEDLITIKRVAGRPEDLSDIDLLSLGNQ